MVEVQFITRERICMVKMVIETQDAHENKRRFPNRNPPSVRTNQNYSPNILDPWHLVIETRQVQQC